MKKRQYKKANSRKRTLSKDRTVPIIIFLCLMFFSFIVVFSVFQKKLSETEQEFPKEVELGTTGIFSAGSGTSGSPYEIKNCTDLYNIRYNPDSYYILVNDIDCNVSPYNESSGWVPIGDSANMFSGNLNGQYFRIYGLKINNAEQDGNGLFGYISESGVIKNLVLKKIDYSANSNTGGLAGTNYGTISQSSAYGLITGNSNSGIIVGDNEGTVSECVAEGKVTAKNPVSGGTENIGGLAGKNNGIIENSRAFVEVSAYRNVGGLVGLNQDKGEIINSYSYGAVTGSSVADDRNIGGLIGANETNGRITKSIFPSNTSVNNPSNTVGSYSYGVLKSSTLLSGALFMWKFPPWSNVNNLYDYPILEWELSVPLEISSCNDLQSINAYQKLSRKYELTKDINCSETRTWNNGVGFITIQLDSFSGVIDGKGYSVYNIYMNDKTKNGQGIFLDLSSLGTISNLKIKNPYIICGNYSGVIAGVNRGSIINVSVENISIPFVSGNKNEYIGGLVGTNFGTIRKCSVAGNIDGNNRIGGLTGVNYASGLIINSYATANINCSKECKSVGSIGGLAGNNSGSITDSYFKGQVSAYGTGDDGSGVSNLGGLAGDNTGKIEGSFSNAVVSATGKNIGGLAGKSNGTVNNSYSSGGVNGSDYVGGLIGTIYDSGKIINSYSIANLKPISGNVGGLIALKTDESSVTNSYYYNQISISGGTMNRNYSKEKEYIINTDWLANNGWLFPPWSNINNGADFPILFWQKHPDLSSIGDKSVEAGNLLEFEISGVDYYEDELGYYMYFYNNGEADLNKDGTVDGSDVFIFYNERIPGDTNRDGRVNDIDLSVIASNYGGKCYSENNWCSGVDLNRDGVVNDLDSSIVASNYGSKCDETNNWCNGLDINKDSLINRTDNKLFNNFLNTFPTGVFLNTKTGEFSLQNNEAKNYLVTFGVSKKYNNLSYDEETIKINAYIPSSPEGSDSYGGGGGGGGGSSDWWKSTFTITEKQFNEGYTKELGERQRIRFPINNTYYFIGIIDLTLDSAVLNVSTRPISSVQFSSGSEKKIDLNKDGYYDLYAKINSLNSSRASLTIMAISKNGSISEGESTQNSETPNEPVVIPYDEENPEKSPDLLSYTYIFVIIAISIIFLVVFIIGLIYLFKKIRQ